MASARSDQTPQGMATMSPGMPDAVNYYRWIVSELAPHLGNRILDIGGGYGAHLQFIVPEHEHVTSIDVSEASVEFMRQRFADYPGFKARHADFGQADVLADLVSRRFDTITCLNVLEHIADDLVALKRMHSILEAQKGMVCLQVPAHQWLYGSLDSQAGHYRRYNAPLMKRVLAEAGFQAVRVHYFNGFGVLPWFVNARILRSTIDAGTVDFQIKIFDRYITPLMRRLESRVRPPFGQSLIAIAKAR